MNKTITINLGGINFHIDENAYSQLKQYLDAVSASLDPESRKETLQDIEARIAELFLAEVKNPTQVINQSMVGQIIETMGQPEDYQVDSDDTTATKETSKEKTKYKVSKKLYRDIDNRVIGGVCSGLGHYVGIDRVWVRIIFLILLLPLIATSEFLLPSGSTVLLIYIILWIAIPSAKTTSEKLEMQGEKIDIDNIERKVKEEYQSLKNNINNKDYSSFTSFLEKLGNILVTLLKGVVIFIGIMIVLIAGISLVAIIVSMFSMGAISIYGLDPLTEMTSAFPILPSWLIYLAVTVLSGIPMLLLLFAGLKIINPKAKIISLLGVLIILGIWVLALIPFIVSAVIHLPSKLVFDSPTPLIEEFDKSALPVKDTLFITALDRVEAKKPQTGQPLFQLLPTTSQNRLKIERTFSSDQKSEKLPDLEYHYEYEQDTLQLSAYFLAIRKGKNTTKGNQELKVTLYINDTLPFKINKNFKGYFEHIPENFTQRTLQFKNGEITCLDCSQDENFPSVNDDEWYQDSSTTN